MKNSNKITACVMALMAVLMFNSAKAQCPDIKNDLTCQVWVNVTEYTSTMSICNGPTLISIPASTTVMFPCNCTSSGTIYEIELVMAGGSGVAPTTAISSPPTAFPGNSTSVPTSCSFSAAAFLYFDAGPNNQFEINQ